MPKLKRLFLDLSRRLAEASSNPSAVVFGVPDGDDSEGIGVAEVGRLDVAALAEGRENERRLSGIAGGLGTPSSKRELVLSCRETVGDNAKESM